MSGILESNIVIEIDEGRFDFFQIERTAFNFSLAYWSKDTVVGGIALMNNSSGHGGTPFPDHELSVLFRNWIVSRKPIDLGEDSFRN